MSKHNIEIETKTPSLNLLQCAVAVKQSADSTRAALADLVRSWDFETHVGGRHVAILDAGVRLALITSDAPDFN